MDDLISIQCTLKVQSALKIVVALLLQKDNLYGNYTFHFMLIYQQAKTLCPGIYRKSLQQGILKISISDTFHFERRKIERTSGTS